MSAREPSLKFTPQRRAVVACRLALLIAVFCQQRGLAENQIGSFSLSDVEGKEHSPDDWRAGKAVVLFFLGAECPVSNGYSPDMRRLAAFSSERDMVVWGVHSDPTISSADAEAHAKEYGLPFTIVLDPQQKLAGAAGVRVTPEAVVLSPEGKVRYRGRIDDRYSKDGKRRDEPMTFDLEAALKAVLAGETPKVAETRAFGCPLPKPKPAKH